MSVREVEEPGRRRQSSTTWRLPVFVFDASDDSPFARSLNSPAAPQRAFGVTSLTSALEPFDAKNRGNPRLRARQILGIIPIPVLLQEIL